MARNARGGVLRAVGAFIITVTLTLLLALLAAVLALRWIDPPTSAFMLAARFEAALQSDRRYQTDYQWRSLEQISPQAALAVIASEDQQFPYHAGFDFTSIRAAVRAHEQGARLRGASTISQQVAKNLFFWSGRSFIRKALEALGTVGHGIYGVEAASRHFFRVPAARLTAPQAALLAAVLPNPRRLHAEAPSRYVLAQRDRILQQMANLGGPAYLRSIGPAENLRSRAN